MKKRLFMTGNSYAPLPVRLLLALVMFPHGAQKLMGWFGGFGFTGTMHYFTGTVGVPWMVGFAVILIEFFGSLAILLGWATRLWSLAMLGVTMGIVFTAHHHYFFMNWFGLQKGEGAEFFLLMMGMAASLVVSGGGAFSIDAVLNYSDANDSSNPGKLRSTAFKKAA